LLWQAAKALRDGMWIMRDDERMQLLPGEQAQIKQGRLVDKDEAGSMEKKKREGYF